MKRRGRARCGLRAFDIEIHHDWVLPASYDHSLDRFVGARVDLPMRHERRDIDEVARTGFVDEELEMLAPAESGAALDDVQHRLQFAVVMRGGFGVRLDSQRFRPRSFEAPAVMAWSDRGGSGHAGSLGRVGIELTGADDAGIPSML